MPVAAFQLRPTPSLAPSLNLGDPGPEPIALTAKHRPRTLAGIVGQGANVLQLETFLEAPYSTAFVFAGPTGVGKTTAALALAAELGAVDFGGLEIVKSGTQDAEMVARVLDNLRFTPMCGSGWKVVVCDEADLMSPKAGQLWLSALEDLPPRSVIIFTTNNPEKFPARFLDRCERLDFGAEATLHQQDAQALVNDVWTAEGGSIGSIPTIAELNGSEGSGRVIDSEGRISYRRVLRALEPLIRKLQADRPKAPTPIPVVKTESFTHQYTPRVKQQACVPFRSGNSQIRRNANGTFTICPAQA